ncbi:putative flavonol 3-O-glucosyltransferase [Helianthus annuus]|uniref:Flavonol 3-O-glucosyltransferase n=1 Tax=Helianthus annuus TaxID=4232 RepID=A0A9K3EGR3_HELAN|nr:putative flavonol 3-O-glucosyltransferase [Helianthus annuus]KAJ0476228.1 putative flavonol 3-O-glucosyltransferase [Helianthus annuus]KAJ0480342.1 putative flavonol 3-O-glucosyltransferase [Helianthus annuus]KAJ0497035.1 putative flavonol 3-O-glucosyltransferase [Helianthus annuus]KAJ0670558.1 putative flavonol 3-O-glucosyltransferase [Helianthus annuus]
MANNTFAELVFIPAPAVGHVMSTIEMAKVLLNRDQTLSVTLLIIYPPYSYIESLAKNVIERIRFIKLPQDQPPSKLVSKAPFMSFYEFINSHCKYVRNILEDAINQIGSRRVVGLVVDILSMFSKPDRTSNRSSYRFSGPTGQTGRTNRKVP